MASTMRGMRGNQSQPEPQEEILQSADVITSSPDVEEVATVEHASETPGHVEVESFIAAKGDPGSEVIDVTGVELESPAVGDDKNIEDLTFSKLDHDAAGAIDTQEKVPQVEAENTVIKTEAPSPVEAADKASIEKKKKTSKKPGTEKKDKTTETA